jgi:YD repeat-containing protein
LGRNTFSEKNSMETTRTYNLLSLLESESYSGTGAVLDDYSVEYDYDDYGRRTRVEVKDNGFSKNKITYGYDTDTGRREWIINGVYKAKYGYASNSSLISSIEFYNGSTRKMTSLKDYDFLNRTISVDSEIESSGKHIGFGYQYNLASQRTQILREDGSQCH